MTLGVNYRLTIHFSSLDLKRLQEIKKAGGRYLLPQGVEMSEAVLELTPGSARLNFSYWGVKPDGTRHKRRTYDVVSFPHGTPGKAWLAMLLEGDYASQYAVEKLWPGVSG